MKQNITSSLEKEFSKLQIIGKKSLKRYIKKNGMPYPKSEEEMYALIDKISGRE